MVRKARLWRKWVPAQQEVAGDDHEGRDRREAGEDAERHQHGAHRADPQQRRPELPGMWGAPDT